MADNEKTEARTKEELEAHLRRLHVRFDEVQGDEPHVMAMLANTPGPIAGPPTRFPAHAERGQCRHNMPPCAPGDALPAHYSPCVIPVNDVKYQRCDVDAESTHLLCHGTRPLSVDGCPRDRNHCG